MFRELTKQNKTTTFSRDSRVGMTAWIISSWSLTYIRETVCVLFLVKAEVWSSAYSRGDGDQHPFLARSSPGGVGEAVTQPKQSSTTLGSPAALTSPSTARSSSVSRHPHVTCLVCFGWFSYSQPRPRLEEARVFLGGSSKNAGTAPSDCTCQEDGVSRQLALVSPSCPLNQGSHPLRALNARDGSSLTSLFGEDREVGAHWAAGPDIISTHPLGFRSCSFVLSIQGHTIQKLP